MFESSDVAMHSEDSRARGIASSKSNPSNLKNGNRENLPGVPSLLAFEQRRDGKSPGHGKAQLR